MFKQPVDEFAHGEQTPEQNEDMELEETLTPVSTSKMNLKPMRTKQTSRIKAINRTISYKKPQPSQNSEDTIPAVDLESDNITEQVNDRVSATFNGQSNS